MFVALPLLFGLMVATLVEVTDRDGAVGRRVPWVVLVVVALAVALPALIAGAPIVGVASAVVLLAFAVALATPARRAWNSRAVTVAGTALYAVLVLWGLYGIVADVYSIATEQPWPLPFNP
jgi:hypothetical protein